MRFHTRSLSLTAAAFLISTSISGPRAEAGFLEGTTLSLEIKDTVTNPPSTWGPSNFVVNDTVEIGVSNTSPVVSFNMEVADDTITFTYPGSSGFNAASFNGYILTAISAGIPAFGSITIDPATTMVGFTASDLSVDSTHFYINVAGLSASAGTVLKLDVTPAFVAPEPASLALAGSGFAFVGVMYMAKRRSVARRSVR